MTKNYEDSIREIVKNNGYLVGDAEGYFPGNSIGFGVGIIDKDQTITRKQGWLEKLRKIPAKKIPAHIASFIVHPQGDISATVFGRSNLDKVRKLAGKVSEVCDGINITPELATEHIKYGPDILFQ